MTKRCTRIVVPAKKKQRRCVQRISCWRKQRQVARICHPIYNAHNWCCVQRGSAVAENTGAEQQQPAEQSNNAADEQVEDETKSRKRRVSSDDNKHRTWLKDDTGPLGALEFGTTTGGHHDGVNYFCCTHDMCNADDAWEDVIPASDSPSLGSK